MGHVIKEDEAADVTSISFEENAFTAGSDRIPSEEVSTPPDADEEKKDPRHGQVLREGQTRRTERPVTITTQSPEIESSGEAGDAQGSGESRTGGEGATSTARVPSSRSDEEWQEHLQEAVEEARSEGYEEGYEAGYETGYEEAEETLCAEHEEQRAALMEDITSFDELWETYIEESEPPLIELTLNLAEAILDAPLTDSIREASEEALAEAVAELANAPPVTVTVHPVDYQRFQESGLADRLTKKYEDLHFESDPECVEGDWSVSSPEGAIRRLRSEVLKTLRSRLGLAPSNSSEEK